MVPKVGGTLTGREYLSDALSLTPSRTNLNNHKSAIFGAICRTGQRPNFNMVPAWLRFQLIQAGRIQVTPAPRRESAFRLIAEPLPARRESHSGAQRMSNRYTLTPAGNQPLNFGVLLVVLCLLIVVAPLATATEAALLVELLFDLLLLAGVYSVAWRGVQSWPFLAFTALTFLVRWYALLYDGFWPELTSAVTTVLWIALVIGIVGGELFRRYDVTTNTIMGAIVAYLLIAIAFAYLYEILERGQPGSFLGIPEGISSHQLGDAFIYFSLVTLTTTGYGDIVPISSLARPVAALEGAVGIFYLAVMIARLVALHVTAKRKTNGDDH